MPSLSLSTIPVHAPAAAAATPVALKVTVVTITDQKFFIAIYVLIASLKYHRVRARINVLGVGLMDDQKRQLEQFEGVSVFEADMTNQRGPTTRKGEAILTAEGDGSEYIALLDGDCIATGDVTPYLEAGEEAFFARFREGPEEEMIFQDVYRKDDQRGGIPLRVLETWRQDVGERETPAITNTVLGGNLIVHRNHLDFVRQWQQQIYKVLPQTLRLTHDMKSEAYFQTDEFVLNSLLAFAADAPPLRRSQLDKDPEAYMAHLGPKPKPWVLWSPEKLQFYPLVAALIEWAAAEGYELPPIPWSYQRQNEWLIRPIAYGYGAVRRAKWLAGRVVRFFR